MDFFAVALFEGSLVVGALRDVVLPRARGLPEATPEKVVLWTGALVNALVRFLSFTAWGEGFSMLKGPSTSESESAIADASARRRATGAGISSVDAGGVASMAVLMSSTSSVDYGDGVMIYGFA